MKLRPAKSSHGGVLAGMLVMIALTLGVLVSVLTMLESQSRQSARSQAWNFCLPLAEAGLEEAMAHLNDSRGINLATNGWTLVAARGGYVKQLTLAPGKYEVVISTNDPPVITSVASIQLRADGAAVSRRVSLTTRKRSGLPGIVSATLATIKDFARADSYRSSPTAPAYSVMAARDQTFIANKSTAANTMEINGNARIYGKVACGGNAGLKLVAPAAVGDKLWVDNPSNGGWCKPGHFSSGFNMVLTNVVLPFAGGAALTNGTVAGVSYAFVLGTGNYRRSGTLTLDGGKRMLVTGKARLYVTDTFDIKDTAQLLILPGASLELYLGKQFYASGSARINPTGLPDQFTYLGLGSNAEFYMSGLATMNGTFYTPAAKADLSGDAQLSGAGACRDLVMQGNFKFHFDESLGGAAEQPFEITSWTEL